MRDELVLRAVSVLVEDAERLDVLPWDHVIGTLNRRGLEPEEVNAVVAKLARLGIPVEREDEGGAADHDAKGRPLPALPAQMRRHRILAAEEEAALGRRIQLGFAAMERRQAGADATSVATLIEDGLRARNELVRSNLRLVAGGPRRALTWLLNGMIEDRPSERRHTTGSLVDQLVASGVSRAVAEQMASLAANHGELTSEDDLGPLGTAPTDRLLRAEREATDLALATFDGRVRVRDLLTDGVPPAMRDRYSNGYPAAIRRAGFETVELADRFPVMRAVYGFTRGGTTPGEVSLNLFSGKRGRRVYADPQQSEALMFRLDPELIRRWLNHRHHRLPEATDPRGTRAAIASAIDLPDRFNEQPGETTIGADLLTLVHTYAHRVIRQLSVFAGVDRESLGEYLLPTHGTFFVFAAARGDFVLGGLQAVFENDLKDFLDAVVDAEHRCPLDPACERNGGACHACSHLGEPVCGHFNRYLRREVLFGPAGYLGLTR
ncbi:hypothetical protein [Micromonospora aurantiaca (nom. illeg.)]|uniref:hypothetical protein n=1 Tax=Micromonospora aurantiaca (nom. illeg.) TaxID=47850 RepID=UPI0036CACD4D